MSSKKYLRFNDYSEIGRRIKGIRKALGLNQAAFGKLFDVKQNTVSQWEKGETLSDKKTLEKIAGVGKKNLDWLIYGDQKDESLPSLQEHISEIYDASPLPPLGFALLVEVETAVDDYFLKHQIKRRPIQRGRLVTFLYEHCAENKEHPSELLVERYLILAD